MDISCETSVEEGSINYGPLLPVDEHKELNSPETGNDDDMDHDQRLVVDTGTHYNGAVEVTEFGCVRTEQLVFKNGVVMCGSGSMDRKCDNVENTALTEKDDDVARTHQCLTLAVSTSVNAVSNPRRMSEDISANSQDKLCTSEVVDNTPSFHTADIKGQNCDILGDNSVEMGGCDNSSLLLVPLSTDVSICVGMKMTSNGSVGLLEKSVHQKISQQGSIEDCCIHGSAPLGQLTTNEDGNSLTISESAGNSSDDSVHKTAAFNDADYLGDKETFKQERNQKDDLEPDCYENVYLEDKDTLNGGQINCETAESLSLDPSTNHENRQNFSRYEPNVSEISLDDSVFEAVKETLNQESDQENGQINPQKAESQSLDSSTANESTKNSSRYKPYVSEVSLDDNVFETVKESSQLESDLENGVKSLSYPCTSSSLVRSDEDENMQSLVSDEDNIRNVTFDDNTSFVENETLKQESDHENSVKTVVSLSNSSSAVYLDKASDDDNNCISNSSSLVHLDKASDDENNYISNSSSVVHLDKASNDDNKCISNSSSLVHLDKASNDDNNCISNSSSLVHLDKASDDENNCISNSSSLVHLDKASDDENNCISNSSSLVHLDKASDDENSSLLVYLDKASDDDNNYISNSSSLVHLDKTSDDDNNYISSSSSLVHLDKAIDDKNNTPAATFEGSSSLISSPDSLHSDNIPETVKCEQLGLFICKFSGKDFPIPIGGEPLKKQELLNQRTQKTNSDLQSSVFMRCEHSVSFENEDNHFKKEEAVGTGSQKIVSELVQEESSSAGIEMEMSESLMTVHKTAYSDKDIQMTGGKTVRCESLEENKPHSLMTSSGTVQSAAREVDELQPLKTVHSNSSGEDLLESSTVDVPESGKIVRKTVHSDSSGEDEPEVLTEITTLHSDSSGEDIPKVLSKVNMTVHSDSSGEDVPEVNRTVHSDSSGEDAPKVNRTVHSDSSGEDVPEVDRTVHSDSSGEDVPEVNMAVHSDSSEEDVPEVNTTLHSDSSEEDVPEVNTTLHSDSSEEDVPKVLSKVNMTVHSDSSGEDVPEVDRTVHSDSSGEDAPKVNRTVHSDSSGEDAPKVNRTVHSDSSGEDVPEVDRTVHSDSSGEDVPEVDRTVHSDNSGEDVLKSSVTSSQPVQSATLEVDISESLGKVRKTVHSDSSEDDDPEMLRKFRKTVPLGRIQRDLHDTGELVEQAALSDSVAENQSDTRLLFCLTEAGEQLCQSLKKSDKKALSKKKKRMKEKKGHRKKSKRKQESDLIAENLRFVEVRRDKYSAAELREEELEAEARSTSYDRLSNERMLVEPYEELLHQEADIQQMGGLKELGEMEYIKERKKKGKKKKKRKRRVATIEEGEGEDNASHQFPTYLDGFFLQYNEGNDDLNDASLAMDIQPRMLEAEDRIHQRHFSHNSEDFVISDNCSDSGIVKHEESRRRRHDRREHKERKRKQRERSHSDETLHQREHHEVTISASREYTFEWERGQRHQEIARSSERKIRRVDREHVRETGVPGREHARERVILNRDRRRIEEEEERRHSAGSCSQDYRTVIAERSPIHSSQHQRRSESRGAVNEAEWERGLGRAKHKDQHNTGRKSHKRDRQAENSQVASSQHRRERGSDKENSRSHKRRRPMRAQEIGSSNYRGRMRTARRLRMRGASMSSSISGDGAVRRRDDDSGDGHCIIISQENSDEDSDVILVESERIIINLDDDEDPPPRVSITRGRKQPAVANKAKEPSIANKATERAMANKAKEIAMENKAKELTMANKAKELTMANKAKELTIGKKATEPAMVNKAKESTIQKKGTEAAMANKDKELAMANKAKQLAVANKAKELAVANKAKDFTMANKAKELAVANKAKDFTMANKATEPIIANKATLPIIANKAKEPNSSNIAKKPTMANKASMEPAMASKSTEPAMASKATEPAMASKATEPAMASKATEPAMASKAKEQVMANKATEPAVAKKANSKSVSPHSEQSISLSRTIQTSNSPKIHKNVRDMSKRERCVAPRLDQHTIEVETLPSITVSADYDPMYPTEDAEEYNVRHPTFNPNTPLASPVGQRPASPDCPAPKKGRPSTPPLPVVMKAGKTSSMLHPSQSSVEEASSSLTCVPADATQSQQQAAMPQRFEIELEQAPNLSSGPRTSLSPNKQLPNGGLTPGHSIARQSLLPTQETVPFLPLQNSQNSVPFLPPPPPPPFGVCLEPVHPAVPVVNQASLHTCPQPVFDKDDIVSHGGKPDVFQPSETCSNQHSKLSSLQPVFDKHHMASHGGKPEIFQPSETCSNQHSKLSSLQPVLTERSPLLSSLAADLSSSCSHSSQGHDGGDMGTRNSVDMDFSSGDDDYHLLLLSPKANSKRDLKRRKQQKQHSSLNQDVSSGNSGNPGSSSEVSVKPGKTLGKDTNKLVRKETLQVTPDKSKLHRGKKKKGENNVREEDEDVPASAADLTCKEKFLRKLYFQERVIEEVKMAIKPFYSSKKITKEQYKVILRKSVPKVCHNKKGNINPQKIQHLVEAYVRKMNQGQSGGGSKKQQQRAGEKHNPKDKSISASVKHNVDRTFGLVR